MMKKTIIYSISLLLVMGLTVGATYAFLSSTTNSGNNLISNATILNVIYTGGTNIEGKINLTSSKEGGLETTVNIKTSEDSVKALSDLYLNIQNITSNIAIDAFKWEVYGYKEGELVYSDTGTLEGKTNNDEITLVNDYKIDPINTSFTVYFWLDGNAVGNEVLGGEFKAYIGARTESLTTELQ